MRRVKTISVPANRLYGHLLKEDLNLFFEPETKRLSEIKVSLLERNGNLAFDIENTLEAKWDDYSPNRKTINHLLTSGILPKSLSYIHSSLVDEFSFWDEQNRKLIKDIQSVLNLFSAAAVRCQNRQDYRDAFPDELWNMNHDILKMERTREPGFMLKDFKVLKRQFDEGVNLLHYYQFNKLVM